MTADGANLLPQTLFVGGAPTPPRDDPPEWLSAIPADAPLALVTLGTTFTGDLGFFSWSAQAAMRAGMLPMVVAGLESDCAGRQDQADRGAAERDAAAQLRAVRARPAAHCG